MQILRTQIHGLTIVGLAYGLELFVWERLKMAKFKRRVVFIKNPNGSREPFESYFTPHKLIVDLNHPMQ